MVKVIEVCRIGRTAQDIPGTVVSTDNQQVAFISDEDLSKLIKPEAGENIVYSITAIGTDAGKGFIVDFSGEALDGDMDNAPGGNYIKELTVIG